MQIKQSIVAKFGFIIPAPFATAPILKEVPSSSCTSYIQVLGYASVVIIAFDKFSPLFEFKSNFLAPFTSFSIGSLLPITPVLLITGFIKSKSSCENKVLISSIPFLPVRAFAFFEFIKTKFVLNPSSYDKKCLKGAAWNLFSVKIAATVQASFV